MTPVTTRENSCFFLGKLYLCFKKRWNEDSHRYRHVPKDQSFKSPKLTVQDAYHKQKLKTYNLGIYCANEDTVHCFFYNETVGTIGPNEVISLGLFTYTT